MPNLRKLLLPFLLIIGVNTRAQSSVGKEFHIDKGLPSNTVRTVCMDDAGSVYIGTTSGIQISPTHLPKNEYITKTVGRAQVWSVIHFKDWLYIGTFDSGLYIFNRSSGSLYKRYNQKEVPGIRRIRILQNKIVGIYSEGAFEIRSLNLYKTFESPQENGKTILPIDIFTWRNKICIAHYTTTKNIYVWDNLKKWQPASHEFLPPEIMKGNHHNMVYLEVNKQLYIGNDKNGYSVVNQNNTVQEFTFKLNLSKQWLQIWDIAADRDVVYIGVGNHLNFNNGFIWKHQSNPSDNSFIKKEISISSDEFIHYPICLTVDSKNQGIWYGSLLDGAYFLKDFKNWISSPTEFIGLTKTQNYTFTWSKSMLHIYRHSSQQWKTVLSEGCTKNIVEFGGQIYVQTDMGIFLLDPNGKTIKQIYSGNSEHLFQLNGAIYWSLYFAGIQGYDPKIHQNLIHDFNNLESVVSLNSTGDFAVALTASQRVYILKNKKAQLISGIFPNNLSNVRIHFYGNMLVIQESKKLSFYSFSESNSKAILQNTIDLNKISLEPINWISANQHGLWLGMNNTLIQLGINKQFPKLNLISEYYLGQNKQNNIYEEKNLMHVTDEACYRKSGSFVEIHPLENQRSLGYHTDWQTEYGNFKVFNEDLLPSIREGQNFKLQFTTSDYIFQNNGYLLTVLCTSDTFQEYRLHHTSKDFWINDLVQGEYQLDLISTGKKMALPLIVSRRLLLNNLFWLLLILIVFMGIYIIYLSQQEKYSLQQRLIGLELATLKSNLNPHFIFNMMNLVQSMIVRSEQKRALKAISELAKINRLFLETSNKELITLDEEIDFAKKYMSLEQMRFEDDKQFSFKINIEPNIELNTWLLPPLIVQPLLENSLKHGVLLAKNNPIMGITISLANPFTLNILIYNSLPENNHRKSDGTNMGIHLVSERIKWVNEKYNEIQTMKMDVLPKMNNEFQVLITINKKDASWLESL